MGGREGGKNGWFEGNGREERKYKSETKGEVRREKCKMEDEERE